MSMWNDIRTGAGRYTRRLLACCAPALLALTFPFAQAQSSAPVNPPTQAPATGASASVQTQTAPAAPQQPAANSTPAPQKPAPTGTAEPADEATAPTIQVRVNEVDLVFTVTDKKSHFVTGLHQSDFGLLDNHMPPEQVLAFK